MGQNCKKKCPLHSSLGKKQIMAVTGLLLCGFITAHLLGNCLLFVGSDAFNRYGHLLVTNPLLIPAELGLLAIFISHIALALRLTYENKMARPDNYYLKKDTGRGATLASSTMPYTGLITLIFLIWHLLTIKYGPHYSTSVLGVEMRDLYRLLQEQFSHPLVVAGYVFSVCALGLHVSHGFWSAFQTLGVSHPRCNQRLRCFSKIFGVIIALGYSALPLMMYFKGGRP